MKIKTEVVTIEEIRYVAEDGKVFKTELDCKKYEKRLAENKLKEKLKFIECCEEAAGYAPSDGAEYYEYHDFNWYRPKTSEEAETLVQFYGLEYGILDDYIGKWLCVESSNSEKHGWCYCIDESIDYVKKLLDKLGYEVTIKQKEDK